MAEEQTPKQPARVIAQASADALALAEILRPIAEGKTEEREVSYETLSHAIGRSVQYEARGCLDTARRQVWRELQRWFEPVRGVGLRLLDDAECVAATEVEVRAVRHKANRIKRKLMCVNFEALSEEDKRKHSERASFAGLVHFLGSGKGQARIATAQRATNSVGAVPPYRLLEELRGRNGEKD